MVDRTDLPLNGSRIKSSKRTRELSTNLQSKINMENSSWSRDNVCYKALSFTSPRIDKNPGQNLSTTVSVWLRLDIKRSKKDYHKTNPHTFCFIRHTRLGSYFPLVYCVRHWIVETVGTINKWITIRETVFEMKWAHIYFSCLNKLRFMWDSMLWLAFAGLLSLP